MTFGFDFHIVCGRVASMKERELSGTKVVNVRIIAKSSSRKNDPFWVDASFWGKNGELFKKSAFKKGDKIAVSLYSLKNCNWQDKFGNFQSTLLGNVDRYFDLRGGPRHEERFKEFCEQIADMPPQEVEAPVKSKKREDSTKESKSALREKDNGTLAPPKP